MHGCKLLLVEDEPSLCCVIEETLRGVGLRVSQAQSCQTALTMLEQESFDLMLLDVRLPDMNGLKMLETLRDSQFNVPTILLTAYPSEAMSLGVVPACVEAVLLKPFDWDLLLSTIRRVFSANPSWAADCPERAPESDSADCRLFYSTPPERAWVTIQPAIEERDPPVIVGQVIGGNDNCFSLRTALVPEAPARVKAQYPGKDGQYHFRTEVIESALDETMGIWVLKRPRSVQRVQRRRFPRLEAAGHVTLIPLNHRVMKAFQADLIDISERGLQVCSSAPLSKGDLLQVVVDCEIQNKPNHFVVQGIVCHAVGLILNHEARYLIGVTMQGLSIEMRHQLRWLSRLALT